MIIEYRQKDEAGKVTSRVLRTYKDVTSIETAKGGATYLYGSTPAEDGVKYSYARPFFIAAINLAPGEYLERVDVPRD